MKKIYNYDATTREFTHEEDAFQSPLEPGVYVIPANATESPPNPKVPEGKRQVFDGQAWVFVPLPTPNAPVEAAPLTDDQLVALCKVQAKQLLADTDYTQALDVQKLLENFDAFTAYRTTVRTIFLAPVKDPIWPPPVKAKWLQSQT
jgi:hypothetical protein